MSNTKMTKKESFEILKSLVEDATELDCQDNLIKFIDHELELLAKRSAQNSKRQAEKKAAADELTEKIFSVLSETPMTSEEIIDALEDEELTKNKVVARMKKLIDAGRAVKEQAKIDKKKVVVYSLPVEQEEETEEEEADEE